MLPIPPQQHQAVSFRHLRENVPDFRTGTRGIDLFVQPAARSRRQRPFFERIEILDRFGQPQALPVDVLDLVASDRN